MNEYQKAKRAAKWSMVAVFGGILVAIVVIVSFWLHHLFFIDFQTYVPKYLPDNGKITTVNFSRMRGETDTALALETNRSVGFVEYRAAKPIYCSPSTIAQNETCVLKKTPKGKTYSVYVSHAQGYKPFGQSYDWLEGETGISMGCANNDSICSLSDKDVEKIIDSFAIKNYGLQKISTDSPG